MKTHLVGSETYHPEVHERIRNLVPADWSYFLVYSYEHRLDYYSRKHAVENSREMHLRKGWA